MSNVEPIQLNEKAEPFKTINPQHQGNNEGEKIPNSNYSSKLNSDLNGLYLFIKKPLIFIQIRILQVKLKLKTKL